jgi:nucleoside-diphosphate-sugar epimerase
MWSIHVASTLGLTLGVAGIYGGLGRELAVQALERGWSVLGLTDDPQRLVREPYRARQLREDVRDRLPTVRDDRLGLVPEAEVVHCDALVLSMSTRPFAKDTSHDTVARLCASLPARCRMVSLVSAWGVGDSAAESNLGIRAMRGWYLRDVYASKELQEEAVANLPPRLERVVYRPRVLSYGPLPWLPSATPRRELARRVLDDVARVYDASMT